MEIKKGHLYWVLSLSPKDLEKHGPNAHRLSIVIWKIPSYFSPENLYVVGQLESSHGPGHMFIDANKYLDYLPGDIHGYVRSDKLRILRESEITINAINETLDLKLKEKDFKDFEIEAFKLIGQTRRWKIIRKILDKEMSNLSSDELKKLIEKGQFSEKELKEKGFK